MLSFAIFVFGYFSMLTQASGPVQCVRGGIICPEVEELNRHGPWQDEPVCFGFSLVITRLLSKGLHS